VIVSIQRMMDDALSGSGIGYDDIVIAASVFSQSVVLLLWTWNSK